MSTAHTPDVLRPHPTNWVREALATVFALVASLLTAYTVWGVVDLATTTYIGGDLQIVQVILVAAGLLTVLAWVGAIALHKSARRDLRAGPRAIMVGSVLGAFGFSVIALVGGPGWISVGAFALAVGGGVTGLIAALRM